MQLKFQRFLSLIMLLGLSFQAFATSFDSYKRPMQENQLVLAFHREKLSDQKGTYSLLVRCQLRDKDGQSLPLINCATLEFIRAFKSDKELLPIEENLGRIQLNQFPALINDLIAKYDSSYNASPLVLGTLSGFVIGVALGEIPLALTFGLLGAVIDIAKAPISFPYTVASKIHRAAQRKNMKKRFENLFKNKNFKPTRILGNMQFHNMTNYVLDFCAINGNNNP